MFTKKYKLTLTQDYVASWGMSQAVREIIQNSLDSESPFKYEFIYDELTETYTMRLDSDFSSLPIKTLLLGSTSKAENKNAIGSFGEGYKIALLVLTRLGHPVTITNGKKVWTPAFEFCREFEEDLLVITEENNPTKYFGLRFEVGMLSAEDVEQIKSSCLLMRKAVGEAISTYKGDILLDLPGVLYVGNLFICNTNLTYGYNIKPEFITLERDRQTVSSWDLEWVVKDMWLATERYDFIAGLMEKDTADIRAIKFDCPELLREACYRLFKTKYKGSVAARSQEELDGLVAKGMTSVVVVSSSSFYTGVSSSNSYLSEVTPTILKLPLEVLEEFFQENKGCMRKKALVNFKTLLEKAEDWRNKY